MGKLSATAVQQAKGQSKPVKLTDGGGLYLLVKPDGYRYWRYNYRFAGKRKTLALGVYPDTSLADARKVHQFARETLAKGIDPGEAKRIERITRHLASADSFEAVATEWYESNIGFFRWKGFQHNSTPPSRKPVKTPRHGLLCALVQE